VSRAFLVPVLLVASLLALPAGGSAAPNDSPLGCADIVSGAAAYDSSGAVAVGVRLAAPACKYVSYTVYVTTGAVTTAVSTPDIITPDVLLFSTIVDPAHQNVCVYAETSVGNGHHVFDRAPDHSGCFTVPQDTVSLFDDFN
jgi:hypothetical protein